MISIDDVPIFQLTYDTLDDSSDDLVQKEHLLRNKLIWKVASTCFAELVVGSLVTGTACCFMATTVIPTFITVLITIVAITSLFHFVEALIDYNLSCHLLRDGDLKKANFFALQLSALVNLHYFLRPYLFAKLDNGTHGVLIHEIGHALTAWLLYENANPQITIHESRAYTSFNEQVLSKWGQQLGTKRVLMVTVAAGAAFAIFEATLLLVVAHVIKDTYHPELRCYLVHMAIRRVITHVFYALEALPLALSEAKGHDFHILWKSGGIHPVAAAATMIAIPILVQYALWKLTKNPQAELEE